MGKLIFKNTDNEFNREMSTIEFEIPDDINIKELKTVFIRMAQAMGYQQKSITDVLGKPEAGEEHGSEEFTRILNELKESGQINFGPEVHGMFDHENPSEDSLDNLLNNLGIKSPPENG